MISLIMDNIEYDIEFTDEYVSVLEIQEKSLFNKVIYRLNKAIACGEDVEGVRLYSDCLEMTLGKAAILVYDMFNPNINQSKIIKYLYEEVSKDYTALFEEEGVFNNQKPILQSVNDILLEYEYQFTKRDILDIKDILKIMDVKFDTDYYDNPLENIYLLFDLINNFKICKVLILVNCKCYYTEEDLNEVYKMAKYKGINLLLIESYKDEKHRPLERKIVIDEDFDEFIIN
ncbi:type II-A CRISPR-associated protein Csn2 [Clostridium sp.]|uniref:type II-A CRISPR-associated protein Csn2 n=1 Tax=Clostridium sp. TaxID=1506 RepID=UPI002FCB15BA